MSEEQNLSNQQEEKKEKEVVSVTPVVSSQKAKESTKMFLYGLVGLVAVVLVIVGGVGVYRVYAKASTDKFTVTVAKILRLPVMKVSGERVLYSDYTEYLNAVRTSTNLDSQNGQAALTSEQITDRVLIWLGDRVLVAKAAKAYGITVEQKDLDDAKAQIMQNFKDQATADIEISKRYGWNLETYMQKIIHTMILQNKLNDKISLDQKGKEEAMATAQKVLDQIKAGGNFEELAKQYGEDGTAANGGSLGWFGKGDMVPQFEAAAWALKKGEIASKLVETEFGYHIVRLNDRKTEKVKDTTTGKMVNKETVDASHILFRFPSIDKYLEKMSKESKTLLYVKVHNPFITDTVVQPAQQNQPAAQ